MLPNFLEDEKRQENIVFDLQMNNLEKIQKRPWRLILGRHQVLQILRFDEEIVDQLPQGRFLEIGGGTCFASAIYKSIYPESKVYASDVSTNTLRYAALPVSRFFLRQPDIYIGVDAENIPFKDNTFDAIFSMTMIHHLPHPDKFFNEVNRALKPGGRFIAIDHCVPKHFRWIFARTAAYRTSLYGIQEKLLTFQDWRAIIKKSILPMDCLHIYRNPAYQFNPTFILAGNIIKKMPQRWAEKLFPVGMLIIYDKV